MNDELFINSIEKKNYNEFKKVPKGDLHVHGILGSNRAEFKSAFNKEIPNFEIAVEFNDLTKFIKNNIIDISKEKNNHIKLIELTIKTAIHDGITIIALSIDYRTAIFQFQNDINDFTKALIKLKNKYKNIITINYDLGISRNNYKKNDFKIIKQLIDSHIFNGIDLYGDELSVPIRKFKAIYRYAKKNKLELKAHLGEYGSAKDIYKGIKILHLNTIQHGISIISNKKVIDFAKKKNIKFNVCPISNIKMGIVDNINNHPIRKMYDLGLKVTINTDDQLIFENSIFDEYLLLLQKNVFTAKELNNIRKNSI